MIERQHKKPTDWTRVAALVVQVGRLLVEIIHNGWLF